MGQQAKRMSPSNKSGFRGVFLAPNGMYRVRIHAGGKNNYIGSDSDLSQAVAARIAAEERHWCGVEPVAVVE
jgi:hypothetical protein